MSCPHSHLDGSYVLGALAPAERQEFEQHLADCAECARSVRDLAGLPGLLARIDPEVLTSPGADDPVPETLLPALVGDVRRTERRRTWVTAGLAAAAAVAVTVGSVAAIGAFGSDPSPSAAPPVATSTPTFPAGQPMVPLGEASVRASVALEDVAWGTRLDLTCTYVPGQGEYGPAQAATYALFVRTGDGSTEQVATWRSRPGSTMQLTAATALLADDITSVEVRAADGTPLLTWAA